MKPIWMLLGAASGFVSVAVGAFGAHALKERISAEMLQVFDTGVRYQMFHALALLAVGLMAERVPNATSIAGWGFAAGTVLFSGSLYVLALTGLRLFGAVTPFGGLAFLIGWAAMFRAAWSLLRSA